MAIIDNIYYVAYDFQHIEYTSHRRIFNTHTIQWLFKDQYDGLNNVFVWILHVVM